MKHVAKLFLLLLWLRFSDANNQVSLKYDDDAMADDDEDFDITYSDDGLRIGLPFFLLQLFETDGELSNDSTYTNIQNACDAFLLAELNAVYSPQHAVDEVNATVFSDDRVVMNQNTQRLLPEELQGGPSRREMIEWEENRGSIESAEDEQKFLRGKRKLSDKIGSEMRMRVNITFASRPTPSDELLRKKVEQIMEDLDNLVTNLTATDDSELKDVYLAIRLEIPTFPPSVSPIILSTEQPSTLPSLSPIIASVPIETDPPTGVQPTAGNAVIGKIEGGITTPEKDNVLMISVVIGITITAFLALLTFIVFRSRRRDDDSEKGVFEEIEEAPSPQDGLSRGYDTRSVTEDSIFSGLTDILTDAGSPKVRGNKSMSSATTVKANNQRHNLKSPLSMAPSSMAPSSMAASTLFAFSEEDEDDLSASDTDHTKRQINDCTPLSPNGSGPSSNSLRFLESIGPGPGPGVSSTSERGDFVDIKSSKSNHSEEEYVSPAKLSADMDESLPYNLEPIVSNGKGAVLAGGVLTAAGVAATKSQQMKNTQDFTTYEKATPISSPSGRSARSTDGAFPSDKKEKKNRSDWSYHTSPDEGRSPPSNEEARKRYFFSLNEESNIPESPVFSPSSRSSRLSSLSGTTTPGSMESQGSEVSASRHLINDLVWLEKKIADVRSSTAGGSFTGALPISPSLPELHAADSMSYKSMDAPVSPSSHGDTTVGSNGILQNIICRDCFAPPGKLQIVIHSTKDGPAVHTVKQESSLEGHIFPGDLIIALDNADTRTFTAEQVMKAMAAKSGFERKITVLHYEE